MLRTVSYVGRRTAFAWQSPSHYHAGKNSQVRNNVGTNGQDRLSTCIWRLNRLMGTLDTSWPLRDLPLFAMSPSGHSADFQIEGTRYLISLPHHRRQNPNKHNPHRSNPQSTPCTINSSFHTFPLKPHPLCRHESKTPHPIRQSITIPSQ